LPDQGVEPFRFCVEAFEFRHVSIFLFGQFDRDPHACQWRSQFMRDIPRQFGLSRGCTLQIFGHRIEVPAEHAELILSLADGFRHANVKIPTGKRDRTGL
jgi:hypothetical protein